MIRLSAAVLTAISAVRRPAPCWRRDGRRHQACQADDQPMVITPHPRGEQLPPPSSDPGGPGVPYEPAPGASAPPPGSQAYVPPPSNGRGTFSAEEIKTAGHRFFGSVSKGLASAIEYTFQRAGRPNGYILGEEAGAPSSPDCATARGCSTPKTRASIAFIGKAPLSATTSAPRAPRPWSLSTSPGPRGDLQRFCRRRRLCLSRRRGRRHIPGRQPRYSCPNPVWPRIAAWRQYRVSEIYPRADLDPF